MAMGNINSVWTLLVVLTTCKSGDLAAQRVELCEREKYLPCLNMARPLLTQAHLVFPDNKRDIDEMCKTWLRFEDCINDYTKDCFTENQQEEFKKAVESPVDLVHRMCTEHQYQQEYLQQAACIQSTITREGHCSPHYKRLLDQVMGENEPGHLCCFHNQFRECVLSETKRNCGSASDPKSAVLFSQQILDKALNFLHVQCSKYPLSPDTCLPPPTIPMDNIARRNNNTTINELVHQQRSTDDMMSSRWQSTADITTTASTSTTATTITTTTTSPSTTPSPIPSTATSTTITTAATDVVTATTIITSITTSAISTIATTITTTTTADATTTIPPAAATDAASGDGDARGSSYMPSTWSAQSQFPASTLSPSPYHRQTPGPGPSASQSWPASSQPAAASEWPSPSSAAAAGEPSPPAWLPSATTASAPHQLGLEHAGVGAGFGFSQPDNGASAPAPAAAAASALLAAALILRL